jgi:ParB/RepB/Spo0J family partition protein
VTTIVRVSPSLCRMWEFHHRLVDHITLETCREEIASFLAHGQLLPVLGRPLHGDPQYKYELIYGARRLFIARHLNVQLAVEVRDLADREGLIAMDIENRLRTDISPYERALSYATWLREGHFASQDELARELKISTSQVSRLLKITRLPAVVIDAFGSPLRIREVWGIEIDKLMQDAEKRALVIKEARAITKMNSRLTAKEAYRRLKAAVSGLSELRDRSRTPGKAFDEVVRDGRGNPLFRIRFQETSVALLLSRKRISSASFLAIKTMLKGILQDATSQPVDSSDANYTWGSGDSLVESESVVP